MSEASFIPQLLEAAPELQSVVDEHLSDNFGELLLHLLVSDIRRFTEAAFEAGDDELAGRALAFLDRALRDGDEPVENAVAVSFVEDAAWWRPQSQPFIATWPQGLQAEAERQRNWHPPTVS